MTSQNPEAYFRVLNVHKCKMTGEKLADGRVHIELYMEDLSQTWEYELIVHCLVDQLGDVQLAHTPVYQPDEARYRIAKETMMSRAKAFAKSTRLAA